MAIDVTSPDLDPVFDDFISKQEKAILETLKYIGEKCEEEGKEGVLIRIVLVNFVHRSGIG